MFLPRHLYGERVSSDYPQLWVYTQGKKTAKNSLNQLHRRARNENGILSVNCPVSVASCMLVLTSCFSRYSAKFDYLIRLRLFSEFVALRGAYSISRSLPVPFDSISAFLLPFIRFLPAICYSAVGDRSVQTTRYCSVGGRSPFAAAFAYKLVAHSSNATSAERSFVVSIVVRAALRLLYHSVFRLQNLAHCCSSQPSRSRSDSSGTVMPSMIGSTPSGKL
jgi:hypothetical protein